MNPLVVNAVAALSLLAIPAAGYAQSAKLYRVGTLFPPVIHDTFRIEMFRQGLKDFGYVEGKNFVLESRLTGKQDFYRPDLAKELVRSGVDLIVTSEVAGGERRGRRQKQFRSSCSTVTRIICWSRPWRGPAVTSLVSPA